MLVDVPDDYPLLAPNVRFEGPKVCIPAVNDQGHVDLEKLEKADLSKLNNEGCAETGKGEFFHWKPQLNIIDCLVAIRETMHIKDVAKKSSSVAGNQYPL